MMSVGPLLVSLWDLLRDLGLGVRDWDLTLASFQIASRGQPMVYACALVKLPYYYLGGPLCTVVVLGPFT